MKNSEVKALLMNALPLEEVYVMSKDETHFQVIAIGEMFNKLSRVQKQQVIYEPLMEYIINQSIHAVSIKTYTPTQWAQDRKLNNIQDL
ncbi:BolA family protein [Candidatus Pantoea carbekii]|nr:BolA family protein [Candidatus Pantoea carbekii]AKC32592.1 protein YrbA [Candidatus Pantoea carbekii]